MMEERFILGQETYQYKFAKTIKLYKVSQLQLL